MNKESNSNATTAPGGNEPQGTTQPQSPPQAERCALEPLRSAVNEGAHRAKAAAERAVPKIKAAVSGATYWLGFGVCFATVFSYTVVKELAPEALRAGCRDGAKAGRKAAENVASELRGEYQNPAATPSPGTASPGPGTEPAVA